MAIPVSYTHLDVYKRQWQINSYNFASTGNIMIGISEVARARGWKVYTSCPAARTMYQHKLKDHIYIGSILSLSLIHI